MIERYAIPVSLALGALVGASNLYAFRIIVRALVEGAAQGGGSMGAGALAPMKLMIVVVVMAFLLSRPWTNPLALFAGFGLPLLFLLARTLSKRET